MGKTESGAIWLSEDKLDVNGFGNIGETLPMKMLASFIPLQK